VQWACHFVNVRRKALDAVVSGYQAPGWALFGALVEGIAFCSAMFAGNSLHDSADQYRLQGCCWGRSGSAGKPGQTPAKSKG
jgi:hypothetical protein